MKERITNTSQRNIVDTFQTILVSDFNTGKYNRMKKNGLVMYKLLENPLINLSLNYHWNVISKETGNYTLLNKKCKFYDKILKFNYGYKFFFKVLEENLEKSIKMT